MPTYGIDIHGTLATRDPGGIVPSPLFRLLSGLMRAWVLNGDKVFILSGPTKAVIEEELAFLGLKQGADYTESRSMVDFIKESGVPMWEDPDGSGQWWCHPEDWNAAKGQIARAEGIDIVVDDTKDYEAFMPLSVQFIHV